MHLCRNQLLLAFFCWLLPSTLLFAKTASEEETSLRYWQIHSSESDQNEEFHIGASRTMHITSTEQFKTAIQIITHQAHVLPHDTVVDIVGWKEVASQNDVQIVYANSSAQTGLPHDQVYVTTTIDDQNPATQIATQLAATFTHIDVALIEAPPVEPIETPLEYPSSPKLDFWLTTTAAVVSGVTHYFVFTYHGASPALTFISSILVGGANGFIQHITPKFAKFINKKSKIGTGLVNRLASFLKTQLRRSTISIPITAFVYAMTFFTGLDVWQPTVQQVYETSADILRDTAFFLGATGLTIEALKVHDSEEGQPLSEKSAAIYKWAFLTITMLGRFAQVCDALGIEISTVVYGGMLTAGAGALTVQKFKFPKLLSRARKLFINTAASCAMAFSLARAEPSFEKGAAPEGPGLP